MKSRFLLDTGIAQDFQAGRGEVRARSIARRREGSIIGICVPVLGELWSGVECSASRERNIPLLRRALANFVIWPYSTEAAMEYGRIFAELRRAGRPMQQVDMQIAAIARTLPHCVIVTKDSDFAAVPGVIVENWAT